MSLGTHAWVLGLVFLTGCAAEPPQATEYLDQQTGVTIRTTAAPFLYAHEMPEAAANLRDYLSIGAVEINNMGSRRYYLVAVSWSTVDRLGGGRAPVPERLSLALGGREVELKAAGHDARSLGVGEAPFRPPSGLAGEAWYLVTPADLKAFAVAPPPSIALRDAAQSPSYLPWRSASHEFAAFVGDIPEARR